jgi:hypothetical protein
VHAIQRLDRPLLILQKKDQMRFRRCGLPVVERIILAVIMIAAGSTFAHAQTVPLWTPVSSSDFVTDVAGNVLIADANDEPLTDDGVPTMGLTEAAAATDADPAGFRFERLIEWRHKFLAWRRTSGGIFPLYASYAALQMVDVHSTNRALDRGGVEANVLMRRIAGSPLPLTLVKASAAASTIYLVEKVRRRSRMGAMLTMVGLNSAYAIVVATNYHR